MKTGQYLLTLAASRIGEDYVYGADVDLFDSDWDGPWDCAEFVSWVIYQAVKKLYGCLTPEGNPDPWTGAWYADMHAGKVKRIPVADAIKTPGAILLRFNKAGHHIVFSDGKGGTIEAMGRAYGVCRGRSVGREWDYGILIPEIQYEGGLT